MKREPMKVRIRGETYASVDEAAKALNVSKVTVYKGIERGRPDSIGLGSGIYAKGANRKPITILGRSFESRSEAARAIGLSRTYMLDLLERGDTDRLRRALKEAGLA